MKEKVESLWKNKKIENMLMPIVLLLVLFGNVNRGLDIYDAGYSMSYFLHFEHYSGNVMISTFLSSAVGHFFANLPGGATWLGLTAYCTLIIAGMVLVAYFLFKPLLGWKITAVLEVVALCFCWAPNTILYNYLSFFLFISAIAVLLKAIEKEEKTMLYILAGGILGFNTFVRISNITQIAAIVLLWYYAFEKKWSFSKVFKRTIFCVTGYLLSVGVTVVAIVMLYGFEELKVGIYNLFFLSTNQEDYGIIQMATGTLLTVLAYIKYLLPLVAIVFLITIILKWKKDLAKVAICAGLILTWFYYIFIANKFRVFNWNYDSHESVFGLVCMFLLWGLICSVVVLICSKNLHLKLYALVYVG